MSGAFPAKIAAKLILLALLASPEQGSAAETWTHGRSSCDSPGQTVFEFGKGGVEEIKSMEQAWEYAQQDVERVAELECYQVAQQEARSLGSDLRRLEKELMPKIRSLSCSVDSQNGLTRMVRMRESSSRIQLEEPVFEKSLVEAEKFSNMINLDLAKQSIGFDDCRSKAQRGWARARVSLNKLSCEIKRSMQRIEAVRARAEAGSSALDCPSPAYGSPSVAATSEVSVQQPAAILYVAPLQLAPNP